MATTYLGEFAFLDGGKIVCLVFVCVYCASEMRAATRGCNLGVVARCEVCLGVLYDTVKERTEFYLSAEEIVSKNKRTCNPGLTYCRTHPGLEYDRRPMTLTQARTRDSSTLWRNLSRIFGYFTYSPKCKLGSPSYMARRCDDKLVGRPPSLSPIHTRHPRRTRPACPSFA